MNRDFNVGDFTNVRVTATGGRICIEATGHDGRALVAWANELSIEGNKLAWILDGRDVE